jgi:hypothetical protein
MIIAAVRETRASHLKEVKYTRESAEMMAYCPGCKAFQTVWLNGDRLMTTRKFTQVGNHVYHNCGSAQPCRLYVL